ncbi:uncharacterized protein UV8b_05834 [Ustilaginoidea virens]|uniref:Uncharacterized protein n=1 Tax=Ustilaginoidea virens TaxID=1159556 RepID=A0A8E5MJA1_USTVR|nr:uncharacterized protein UV8b_05834 [Ustilaginoidea virens]QUC21591.1 hypothetical protein UV8b_05834 [Ustilaginoidea virens]
MHTRTNPASINPASAASAAAVNPSMALDKLLPVLDEVQDPRRRDLCATSSLAGRWYAVRQDPAVLTSSRPGGTTGAGAVVWRISPLLAEWLARPSNPLRGRAVLELGLCATTACFATGLGVFMERFRVWRLREGEVPGMAVGDGFVVHVGVLKDGAARR